MAGFNAVTYAAAKTYTDQTVSGGGALKGKNCTVDSITDITGGHRVTFKWTLDNGTVQTGTMDVMDGVDGQDGAPGADGHDGAPGADGLTPTIEVTEITGGHRVTITIGEETPEVFDVMDGAKGEDGDPGPAGPGVPAGGSQHQVLRKIDGDDYNTEWADPEGGQTIQVNALPSPSSTEAGKIYQYVGATSGGLTNGYFYKCVEDTTPGTYKWENVDVQAGGSGGSSTLSGLDDVDLDVPLSEGQFLGVNSSGEWENKNFPTLGTAAALDVATTGDAENDEVVKGNDSRLTDARNAADVYSWAKAETKPTYTASEVGAVATTSVGANNDVAPLDASGKIGASYLPSYVDDVVEGYYYDNKFYEDSAHTTEITPEGDKIYVDLTSLKEYRWSGTAYSQINAGLALGETAGTAYEGSKGAANAAAIQGIKNGTTINSFGAVEDTLSDYIKTSATSGLVKNDGTIDTTAYQDSTDKMSVADMEDVLTPLPSARGNWQEYSTTEHRVGTWINGKPLYQKTYDFGALPNATTKQVSTGLTNVNIRRIYGYAFNPTSGTCTEFPFLSGSLEQSIALTCTESGAYIKVDARSADRRAFSECYITLQYTKTTD